MFGFWTITFFIIFYSLKIIYLNFQFFKFRPRPPSQIDEERRIRQEEQQRSDEWNGHARQPIIKPIDKPGNGRSLGNRFV